ncbi:MAG TPA: hypothetical protein VHZ55_18635, partial [Bryobacteraceae bacterium]|nr:hypothetical protein [Bryobacteraceae bacterium]
RCGGIFYRSHPLPPARPWLFNKPCSKNLPLSSVLNFTEPPMPKNQVTDPNSDQEVAFARLVLSGTMTDRDAAQAVGLNPDAAAYTKSKPRVRAYMLEHRAAVQQQLVEQETDLSRRAVESLHRLNLGREQVLARLREIANLGPEMTRGSITGQVKALSMIVAIQNLIPDRRTGSLEKKSAPPPTHPDIYRAAWLGRQQENTIDPPPDPALAQEEDEPACPGVPWGIAEPETTPGSAGDAPAAPAMPLGPAFDPSESAFVNHFHSSETTPEAPHAPVFVSAPDNRRPFSIKKNPFTRRR